MQIAQLPPFSLAVISCFDGFRFKAEIGMIGRAWGNDETSRRGSTLVLPAPAPIRNRRAELRHGLPRPLPSGISLFKGANPSDPPVIRLTKVELVINVKTAKTLGVSFPLSLLGRADEVIE